MTEHGLKTVIPDSLYALCEDGGDARDGDASGARQPAVRVVRHLAAELRKARGMVGPFALSIIATFLASAFGVVTNKVVAVWGGPSLSALVALYRQLYATVTQGLSLGADVTVVQAVSVDNSEQNRSRVAVTGLFYLLAVGACVGIAASLFPQRIGTALLGEDAATVHPVEITIVLLSSVIGLALTLVLAILNGMVAVRRVLTLNLVASGVAATAAYVLVTRLHSVGAAVLVGFGNIAALIVGVWFVAGHVRLRWAGWQTLRSDLVRFGKSGSLLAVLSFLAIGVMLVVQTTVARTFGLVNLGVFTASYTIITAFMMLFMSPMKVYVLPMLGRLAGAEERHAFVNQAMQYALVIVFPFAAVLLLGSAGIVEILYSSEFTGAGALLAVESLGVVPRTMSWVLAIYTLSANRMPTYVLADAIRAVIMVTGTGAAVWLDLPLASIAWVFFAAYVVDLIVYLVRSRRDAGFRLSPAVALLATGMMGVIAALYGVALTL